MEIPAPLPGLVVRYSFLWHREFALGRTEGQKDRPCAIMIAVGKARHPDVIVLPITHSLPDDMAFALEIPPPVKQRLGLDPAPSWVVLNEANRFVWPGVDLRPVSPDSRATCAYGHLPANLFFAIRDRFVAIMRAGRVTLVPRPD